MTDKTQLPFLLKLVDDKSPRVRAKVARALTDFGPGLRQAVAQLDPILTKEQSALLEEILGDGGPAATRNPWLYWLDLGEENEKLEAAFALLADWQLGSDYPARVGDLLDDLAAGFLLSGREVTCHDLCSFLFADRHLQGAASDHYYSPLNSNLVSVIESGHGIPISLASIFILVGRRLGLKIHGCNFPSHFLAWARDGERDLFFDCFNGGRLLAEEEVESLRKVAPLEMSAAATSATMIARVLSNLAVAYYQAGDLSKTQFLLTLLNELKHAVPDDPVTPAGP